MIKCKMNKTREDGKQKQTNNIKHGKKWETNLG